MRKGSIRARISVSALLLRTLACLTVSGVVLCLAARADNGWERPTVSLIWDNDATYGTDRHYTQGAQLTYYSADEALPGWMRRVSDALPAVGFEVEARKWGLNLGQQIYTPDDLNTSRLIEDDRPYAAWLFAGFKLQRRGPGGFGLPAMETLRFEAGVIGPEALGKEAQGVVHLVAPEGWRNQLRTEPGLLLHYERRYLYRRALNQKNWQLDLIPAMGLAAGNIATFASLGAQARIGRNVPNEFETANGPAEFRYGWYCFLGLEGRTLARNIFLDGNTARSSHSVDKEPLVGDFRAGVTLVLKRFELTLSQTFRSREFESQKHNDSFGTLMMLIKF
jgi:lipid A 3-O-deacylase